MTDGFTTGFHHALWALGYLAGISWVLLGALLIWAPIWWAWGRVFTWVGHRRAVARVRRAGRRAGRLEGPGWNGAD